MRVIYKYRLDSPRTTIDLPWGTQILTVQIQGDVPVLWAIVDQNEAIRTVRRVFVAVNTGVSFDLPIVAYLATVMSENGIVWHIFEVQP